MSHYFIDDPSLSNDLFEISFTIKGKTFAMFSSRGVFSKNALDFGSDLLINQILLMNELKGTVLDLGCGIGVIGLSLATFFNNVAFCLSDVNNRAITITNKNIEKLKLANAKTILSDLFNSINEKFDFIISNPPIRAGKKVVYQLFEDSFHHLNPSGVLYLVIRKEQGALSAIEKLKTIFPLVSIIERKKGYYIIKCQKD